MGVAERSQAPANQAGRLAGDLASRMPAPMNAAREMFHAAGRRVLPAGQPDLPGPRSAAFYGHRYGIPVPEGEGSGTAEQMDLLRMVRRQGAQIRDNRNQVRLGRYRDMAPPTSQDFVSEEDLIRRFASTPEMAERALEMQEHAEFRRTNPRPNRRPANVRLSQTEFHEERRNKPRRPPARTAMPPGMARGEMVTPAGPPRSLRPA